MKVNVNHDDGFSYLFKAALPLAASTRARTRVRSKLAGLLMIHLSFIVFTVSSYGISI